MSAGDITSRIEWLEREVAQLRKEREELKQIVLNAKTAHTVDNRRAVTNALSALLAKLEEGE
jgi:hypothetical protein